jgi:hypothetical protein
METNPKEKNKFSQLKEKVNFIMEDIRFLKKCQRIKVFPKFIDDNIKCAIRNNRTKKIIQLAKNRWLVEEKKHLYCKLEMLELELYNLHLKLTKNLKTDHQHGLWNDFNHHLQTVIEKKVTNKRNIQLRKYDNLRNTQKSNIDKYRQSQNTPNFVINKSKETFSAEEMNLLNKGLNYAIKPKNPPMIDFIAAVESGIQYQPDTVKNNIRNDLDNILKTHTEEKVTNNMSKTAKLLKDKNCFYTKADKGNAVVIMDTEDYDNAVLELLENGPYERRTRNPLTNTVEKTRKVIKTVIERFDLPDYMKYRLKVSNPVIPAMYALPKIHKPGNKMRPIVSAIGSPTEPLAKWLLQELKSITPPPGLDIKNSIEFTEKLREFEIEEDELLVSFDVTSLYPSIPIDIAKQNMEDWLVSARVDMHKVNCYMEVVNLCMEENYFKFRDNVYKQTEGTSMGNPLSPMLANIYMKKFETDLSEDRRFPRCWLRYVDDIFVILKKDEIDKTLDWINKQHVNIQFTIELEVNNQLPFLDVLVKRQEKRISFSIYRKPTNTEKYIAADSFHPTQHKHAAFHSMAFRMCNINMSLDDYKAEKQKILDIGRRNGYTEEDINVIIHKQEKATWRKQQSTFYENNEREKLERNIKRISIPHWPKITNHMKKTFKKQKIEIITTSSEYKIKNKLGTTKDKKEVTEKSGIYQINCATRGCNALYIGQTRRAIAARFNEHEKATKSEHMDKSSVAKHMIMKDDGKKRSYKHKFTKENLKVVKPVNNFRKLDAYESIYLFKNRDNPLMNNEFQISGNIKSDLFKYS